MDRSKVGNPAEWYADTSTGVSYVDKTNYMPNISFGGTHWQYAGAGQLRQHPVRELQRHLQLRRQRLEGDAARTTSKAGFYFETPRSSRSADAIRAARSISARTRPTCSISSDGFSNALLGNFNTYSEGTARVNGDWSFKNLEFYVQDNWRVIAQADSRFRHAVLSHPAADRRRTRPSPPSTRTCFTTSNIPVLYMPTIDRTGSASGVDPRTGTIVSEPATSACSFPAPA